MDVRHLSSGIEILCNVGPVLERQSHGPTESSASGSLSSSTNLKSLGVQIDCEQPNTIKPLARWRVVPAVVKSNHITWSGRSARNERDGAPTCPANIASYNKEQAS